MLTGMQIAVIGGDARQIEVIKKLSEMDAKVYLFGFDKLSSNFPGVFKETIEDFNPKNIDAVILAIPGCSDDGHVEGLFSNKKIILTEQFISQTKPNSVIYSGIGTDYLERISKKTKRQLVKVMDRDDIAIYNSIPTAEGVIMHTIQNTDFTINGANVAILGLGRCGQSLVRTFMALGANVKVCARRSEHIARAIEMGAEAFYINQIEKEMTDVDICINTIPAKVLTSNVLAKMPLHTYIIDIASKPGGTDFRYAEKRGIKAFLAPGLPGIVAPKTAGQIIAKVISELLTEQKNLVIGPE